MALWGKPEWTQWLQGVDEVPPAADVIESVATFLEASPLRSFVSLDGMPEADILGLQGAPTDVMEKAFVRRAAKMAVIVAEANRNRASVGTGTGAATSQALAMQAQAAGGGGASAMALAQVLSGAKQADVQALLRGAGLDDLPHHIQAEQSLWQVLWSATEAGRASQPPATPFVYVDLTSRACLPIWLLPEAIGGKLTLPGEQEWVPQQEGSSSTLTQLSQALKGAVGGPRFFRTLAQWVAAFQRYATTAVATGQLNWTLVSCHIDVVMSVAEQVRPLTPLTAILYDDMVRKNWAYRAERRDPSLKLCEVMSVIDKTVLEAAKQRIEATLKAAGVTEPLELSSGPGGRAIEAATESAALKNQAALEALNRRSAEQTKALQKAQESLGRQRSNFRGDGGADSSGGKGGGSDSGGYGSGKKRRAQAFFEKSKAARKQNSKGWGKGGRWQGGNRY